MAQIIISAHGEYAMGIKSGLSLIAGDLEHIHYVNFQNDTEKLKSDIVAILNQHAGQDILILTDLVGGSPFKTGAMLSKEYPNIKVIGGVNLPMVLSLAYDTESSLNDLVATAVQSGTSGIKEFK